MRSVRFPEMTGIAGMDQGAKYSPLPVQHYLAPEGNVIRAAFLPDDEERTLIAAGHPVFLEILGTVQPPVRLLVGAEKLPEEPRP